MEWNVMPTLPQDFHRLQSLLSAGRAASQVRTGDEPEDCEGAGTDNSRELLRADEVIK
jgi:hypothetical protein